MNTHTKLKTTLKHLPLISALALGLALSPLAATAGDRDHGKGHSSKNVGHAMHKSHNKAHNKSHKRDHKAHYRTKNHGYDKHNHKRYGKKHHRKHGHKSKHHKHYAHNDRHNHRYGHDHGHRGHAHTRYIVNEHYYPSDHYYDYDRLGFMIGLHSDNFDITFRD